MAAGYLELYRAQADNSRAHHASITKYLYHPKRKRDESGDPRERFMVVPNSHGSSGLAPMGALRWRNNARVRHPLVRIAETPGAEVATRESIEAAAPRTLGHAVGDLVRSLDVDPPAQKTLLGKV